jgi:cytosine/adenosine deaminase-related metal-dependent hydrolase
MSIPVSYRARWIFPVDRPPIAHGTLTIVHNRIMAVDPPGRCPADVDLGQVAILPGLVNAHTHLDLGALQGKLKPPGLFTDWLREVVAYRRSSTPDEWTASIRAGIDECLRSGVTLVGDIATGGLSADLLRASPLRSVVFFEVIGLTQSRAEQTWVEFEAWIRLQKRTSRYRPGISPHAPYTVCHWLLLLARGAVEQHGLPLAIHFAETGCEAELLKKHTGPLRRFLEELGAWNEEGLSDSLPWIADTCLSYAPSLFVH